MKKDLYNTLKTFDISGYIKKIHKAQKLRCTIFGNFGAMNLGDEAILAGEISELKKIRGLSMSVVARNIGEVKRIHHENAISLLNIFAIIAELYKSDFVIVGGGGIICKADRGLIGIIYQLYMLFISLLLPKLLGKKIYAIGLGVYDNTNPFVLHFAVRMLRLANLVTVRDYHSYDLLKKYAVDAKLYKDNSFLLKLLPQKDLNNDSFIRKNYDKKKMNIGLALLKPDSAKMEMDLIDNICELINMHSGKANFWVYSCDFQENYFNDQKLAEKLYAFVRKQGNEKSFFFIPTNWHPAKFFSSFKFMDFFITMRLHASIFAYRNDVNFVSIPYDMKCESFLSSIGKKELKIKDLKKMGLKFMQT